MASPNFDVYSPEEDYSVAYSYRQGDESFYTPEEQEKSYRFNHLTRCRANPPLTQHNESPPNYIDLLADRLRTCSSETGPHHQYSRHFHRKVQAVEYPDIETKCRQHAAAQVQTRAGSKELDSLIDGMMVKLFNHMTLASVRLPGFPEDDISYQQPLVYVYTRGTYWALETLWGIVSLCYATWAIPDYAAERYFGLSPPFPMWLYTVIHACLVMMLRKLCIFVVTFGADSTAMNPDRRAWSRRNS